nr:TPA_asm: hypothetical protein [Provittati virus]
MEASTVERALHLVSLASAESTDFVKESLKSYAASSSEVKEAVVALATERARARANRPRDNHFDVYQDLNQDQKQRLAREFCSFGIRYSKAYDRDPHAYARAHRKCSEKWMMDSEFCLDALRSGAKGKILVKDVGANVLKAVKKGDLRVHSCCPTLGYQDALRHANAAVGLAAMKETEMSGRTKTLMQEYRSGGGQHICFGRAQLCVVKAQYLMFLHSAYDIGTDGIAEAMWKARAVKAVGVVLFQEEMHWQLSGYIAEQECSWERHEKKIRFVFTGDSQVAYEHDFATYMSLVNTHSVKVGNEMYLHDVIRVSDGVLRFRMLRNVERCIPGGVVTRPIPIKDSENMMVVLSWRCKERRNTLQFWSNFVNLEEDIAHNLELVPIRHVIDRQFFNDLFGYAMNLQEGKFTWQQVFNLAKAANKRIIINGSTVQSGANIDCDVLVEIVVAVYMAAYRIRYEASTAIVALQRSENAGRRNKTFLDQIVNKIERKLFGKDRMQHPLKNMSTVPRCPDSTEWNKRAVKFFPMPRFIEKTRIHKELWCDTEPVEISHEDEDVTGMLLPSDANEMDTLLGQMFPNEEIGTREGDLPVGEFQDYDCRVRLVRVETPGDGDCAFHGLALAGVELDVCKIRKQMLAKSSCYRCYDIFREIEPALLAPEGTVASWMPLCVMRLMAEVMGITICVHSNGCSRRCGRGSRVYHVELAAGHFSALKLKNPWRTVEIDYSDNIEDTLNELELAAIKQSLSENAELTEEARKNFYQRWFTNEEREDMLWREIRDMGPTGSGDVVYIGNSVKAVVDLRAQGRAVHAYSTRELPANLCAVNETVVIPKGKSGCATVLYCHEEDGLSNELIDETTDYRISEVVRLAALNGSDMIAWIPQYNHKVAKVLRICNDIWASVKVQLSVNGDRFQTPIIVRTSGIKYGKTDKQVLDILNSFEDRVEEHDSPVLSMDVWNRWVVFLRYTHLRDLLYLVGGKPPLVLRRGEKQVMRSFYAEDVTGGSLLHGAVRAATVGLRVIVQSAGALVSSAVNSLVNLRFGDLRDLVFNSRCVIVRNLQELVDTARETVEIVNELTQVELEPDVPGELLEERAKVEWAERSCGHQYDNNTSKISLEELSERFHVGVCETVDDLAQNVWLAHKILICKHEERNKEYLASWSDSSGKVEVQPSAIKAVRCVQKCGERYSLVGQVGAHKSEGVECVGANDVVFGRFVEPKKSKNYLAKQKKSHKFLSKAFRRVAGEFRTKRVTVERTQVEKSKRVEEARAERVEAKLPASRSVKTEHGLCMDEFMRYLTESIRVETVKYASAFKVFCCGLPSNRADTEDYGFFADGCWQRRPKEFLNWSYCWDGENFVEIDLDSGNHPEKFVVGPFTEVCHDVQTLERCSVLGVGPVDVDGSIVQAPPGTGKSYQIIERSVFDKGDALILCSTRASRSDMVDRVRRRYPDVPEQVLRKKVRTLHSVLLNSDQHGQRVFIDEAFMHHAGMVLFTLKAITPKSVVAFGDVKQIPFVNRLASFSMSRHRLWGVFNVTESLMVTRRSPIDVVSVLAPIYDVVNERMGIDSVQLRGTNNRINSCTIVSGAGVENIPVTNDDWAAIALTRSDKAILEKAIRRAGGTKRVMTIHEFQGQQARHMLVYRSSTTPKSELYEREEYALVALSRHTETLTYVTGCPTDRLSEMIRATQRLDQEGAERFVVAGGATALVDAVPMEVSLLTPTRLAPDIDLTGMSVFEVKTALGNIARTGQFRNKAVVVRLSNLRIGAQTEQVRRAFGPRAKVVIDEKVPLLRKAATDISAAYALDGPGLDERLEYIQNEERCEKQGSCVECEDFDSEAVSFWLEEAIPGATTVDIRHDVRAVADGDLSLHIPKMTYSRGEGDSIKTTFDCLTPIMRTPMPDRRPRTQTEVALAFQKRNANVPLLAGRGIATEEALVMWDSFVRSYLIDGAVNALNIPMRVGVQDVNNWLRKQQMPNEQVAVPEFGILESDLSGWTINIRPAVKPPLDEKGIDTYGKLQTIVYQGKDINAFYVSFFRELMRRITELLRPQWLINTLMSPEDFDAKLAALPQMSDCDMVELDIGSYDKSQGETALEFELLVMERCGVPPLVLQAWRHSHESTKLRCRSMGMTFRVDYQRKSGDANTFGGNTLFLMAVMARVYDMGRARCGVFGGDDSLLWLPRLRDKRGEDTEIFAVRYGLEAKLLANMVPYFCSKFLLLNSCGNLVAVADPLKVVVKLGRTDLRNEEHVKEYCASFADTVRHYLDADVQRGMSVALADRYGVKFGAESVMRMLASLVDEERFCTLWYRAPGARICDDPCRWDLSC